MRKLPHLIPKNATSQLADKKQKLSNALWQPKMSIFFLQFFCAGLYHITIYFFHDNKRF